jgi:parallel beta-helix repeat protein
VATPGFGALANGVHPASIQVTVLDTLGNPVAGRTVELSANGSGNVLVQPPLTDANGRATGSLVTTTPETKTVAAVIDPGPDQILLTATATVAFVPHDPNARFVRVGGSDLNDGLSPAEAWASIGKAAAESAPDNVIYVGGGTYKGTVPVTTSGTPGKPITFRADPNGTFTGDEGEVIVDAWSGADCFQLDGVSDVVVEGFTLVGAVPGTGNGGAIRVGDNACTDVVLRDNVIYGSDRGIHVLGGSAITIERTRISNNFGVPGDGIVLDGTSGASVRGNLVYNVSRQGIRVEGGTTGTTIDFNTLYSNGGDQLHIDGAANDVVVRNNVVSQGLAAGLVLRAGSSASCDHNLVWGQSGANWVGMTASPSSIDADPVFESPTGSNGVLGGIEGADDRFNLDELSPAIDAGSKRAKHFAYSDGTLLSGWSTRIDQIADGTHPDGKQVNLGFHYAAKPKSPSTMGAGPQGPGGTASGNGAGAQSTTVAYRAPGALRAPPGLEGHRVRAGDFSWNVRVPGALLSRTVGHGRTAEAPPP